MRKLEGFYKLVVVSVGIAMVLYTVLSILLLTSDPWIFNATHLTLALIMVFWLVPAKKTETTRSATKPPMLDIILSLMSLSILIYINVEFAELIYRAGSMPTTLDIVFGIMTVIVVLEASRRAAGLAFTLVAVGAIAYTLFGGYLPGLMGHKGYSIARTISYIFSGEGIYGSTLKASASFAILFITLGAFFQAFGAADFFNNFAMAVSGHRRGGPGKVAVVASALFGTISGHAAGNVATTGTFTIPMMKRIGYEPAFAGAVEAAASTGGQILPPVMGTVVFVMIEITGISYSNLIVAAAIPALLYYFAVYLMVDFEALNLKLVGLPKEELPSVRESLRNGYFFAFTIFVLLFSLFILKTSVSLAALYTLGTMILISTFQIRNPKTLIIKTREALYNGAVGTMKLAPLTAAAGIVIGVVSLTGIGVKLGRFLIALSGGEMFFVLFFTMILSLILGMGMSSIPAYVIAAAVAAPALIQLGIPVLQAHLFVLYYGIISTITPPIAISAFTAAGIADSDPMKTGFKATKLAYVGFIVPFLFVYRPALLCQGTPFEVVYAIAMSVVAIYSLTRGLQLRTSSKIERILLGVGSLILLFPKNDLLGFCIILAGYAIHFLFKTKKKDSSIPI